MDNLFTFKNSDLIDDMAEGLNSSPQEQGGKPPQGVGTACWFIYVLVVQYDFLDS